MKKKLLVLLIALASTMMPNLASAVVIETGGCEVAGIYCYSDCGWICS